MVTARLLLLALIGLAACTASEGPAPLRPPSYAARILAAAEIDEPGDAATVVASAQPVAPLRARSGSLLPGIGLLALGNTGAGAASLLRPDRRSDPERAQLFGFIPAETEATGFEAQQRLFTEAQSAFEVAAAGVPEASLESREDIAETVDGPVTVRSFAVQWSASGCAALERGPCRHQLRVQDDQAADRLPVSPVDGRPAWRPATVLELPGYDRVRYVPVLDELPLLSAVSGLLPDWAFLHVPANRIGVPDETGALRLLPVPVLFHRGRAHFFAAGLGPGDGVDLVGWGAFGPIAASPEATQ